MPAPRIDWLAAKSFYLGLDRPRSFGTVARRYGVSDTAVRKHAIRDGWREQAASIDAEALKRERRDILRSRDERVRQALRIVDGYLDRYTAELDRHDLRPGDLPGIVKLAELLEGEATDRVSVGEVQMILQAAFAVAAKYVPRELRAAFLADLDEVTGRLQLPAPDVEADEA